MGIDVNLNWDGKTVADYCAQISGFDATIGATGYLREAYHGEPYATRVLAPEGFDGGSDEPCSVHGAPLGDACYEHEEEGGARTIIDRVLAYKWQRQGDEVEPTAEDLATPLHHCDCLRHGVHIDPTVMRQRTEAVISAAIERERTLYPSETTPTPADPIVKSYVDFIDLYLRLAEEGKHPRIYVSH